MKFIDIISSINDTSALLELKHRFEEIGLTIQQAHTGKIFICRVENGKPCHNTLYEDHFPVGMPNSPVSERTLTSIIEFILTNKGSPQTVVDNRATGNYGLYGSSVRDNRVNSELISAIDEFLFGG